MSSIGPPLPWTPKLVRFTKVIWIRLTNFTLTYSSGVEVIAAKERCLLDEVGGTIVQIYSVQSQR
jgi:hypothetical protein